MLYPEVIISTICRILNVAYEEVAGKSRKANVVEARHTAIYFMRKEGYKTAKIMEVFDMQWEAVDYVLKKIDGFIKIDDTRNAVVLQVVQSALQLIKTEQQKLRR